MNTKRLRGLRKLIEDLVEHGSRAVERVQKETAARPFAIVEAIPTVAAVARGVHAVYDASVSGVHGTIRVVNRAVGATLDATLDVIEAEMDRSKPPEPEPPESDHTPSR